MTTAEHAGPPPRALRVLVVEDHEDSRELLAEVLRSIGPHAVDAAADADGGLKLLRRQGYDLVITDFGLPNATGMELLESANAEGLLARTMAIVCSASGDHGLELEVQARGWRFLPKPLELQALVALIQQAGAGLDRERDSGVQAVEDGNGQGSAPEPAVSGQAPASSVARRCATDRPTEEPEETRKQG